MKTKRLTCAAIGALMLIFVTVKDTNVHVRAADAPVTYTRQVAPILYRNCTTCHHPGGAGPFSLMTYMDARRWGSQVLRVTQSRYMPPWLPEPGYGDFADNRRLSESDLNLIRQW